MLTAVFEDGKIGRRYGVKPLDLKAADARDGNRIAEEVYRHIRKEKLLASREVEVEVYDDRTGDIAAGGRVVGRFTIVELA